MPVQDAVDVSGGQVAEALLAQFCQQLSLILPRLRGQDPLELMGEHRALHS